MNRFFRIQFLVLSGIFLISCAVQKRRYTNGFYVSTKHPSSHVTAKAVFKDKLSGVSRLECSSTEKGAVEEVKDMKGEDNSPLFCYGEVKRSGSKKISRTETMYSSSDRSLLSPVSTLQPLPEDPSATAKPDESDAVIALALSIGGFFLFPLIGSVLGLILANRALKKIQSDPAHYGGKDLAEIARIVAIVGLILSIFILLIFTAFMIILLGSI